MKKEFFSTSLEHIYAELKRIALLIKLHVLQAQQLYQNKAEFQGLFISEQEVDRLLKQPMGWQIRANSTKSSSLKKIRIMLAQMAESIAKRTHESYKQGVTLRLEKLSRSFNLTSLDVDILLTCLLPELDLKYERLFSYLQDDITRKRPSVDLVLNLLCSSFQEKLAAREHFDSESPLFKHSIIYIFDDLSQKNSPLLSKFLKLDERLVSYLIGKNSIDFRLRSFTQYIEPNIQFKDLVLPVELVNNLSFLATEKYAKNEGLILYFKGPYGVGKQSTAEAMCKELGRRILVIEGNNLLNSDGLSFEEKLGLVMREATLQESTIYWNGFDTLLAEGKRTLLGLLLDELEVRKGLTFLSGDIGLEPKDALYDRNFALIKFPTPSFGERLELWKKSLNANSSVESDVDLTALANKFRFSGGQIRDAVASARNRCILETTQNTQICMSHLYTACRAHSNKNLGSLAQKIEPKFIWDDIILPKDQLVHLREVTSQVKHKHVVYEDWGFIDKLSLGKGLNILFHGPPGTGKTMAADIMANELQLDLYKIDLSTVVSKYIGETEKNLSKIFKEAETSNAILFFDEADALFGKRSEVNDAHDRYANIEIAYLLQKMEEYEGITILATNLMQNIDEAFVRRIRFIIEFPFPTEEYRLRIWEGIWPQNTPVSPEVDFAYMAEQFEIAGGNIRNIALNATFYAAADGHYVTMKHMVQATKRELQKMGNLLIKADFGAFQEYV